MFIRVLPKAWCRGRAPPQPPPRFLSGMSPGGSGHERIRTILVAALKKKNPPYAGRMTFIWGIAFGNRLVSPCGVMKSNYRVGRSISEKPYFAIFLNSS